MELAEYTPETQACRDLPYEEVVLFPISDVQLGAPGCNFDDFKRWIDYGMRLGAYFYGLGDYLDVASPSGRKKIKDAEFYESVSGYLEDKASENIEKFLGALKGTEGRWLFMLEGHHYYEFEDGSHSDIIIADALGAPFLGTSTIFQLKFKNRHRSQVCQIWAHHGEGSGRTMASPLNKLEQIMSGFPSVDIFTMGHYHRACGYPVVGLIPIFGEHPRLKAKRRILACTGGWLKSYVVGNSRAGRPQGTYPEKGMMKPMNLGGVIIRVRPLHKQNYDYLWPTIEV